MVKNDVYYFHQTPAELASKLINEIPLEPDDKVLEPFKGEGAFYNSFPDFVNKDWCEIEEGRDFLNYNEPIDWVISNPPFRLENNTGKRENAFYKILRYYAPIVNKGIAFLGNDSCFSTLTPKRLKELNGLGLYIDRIVVSSIKKWRGRYFFIIFKKQQTDFYRFIEGNF